MCGGSCSPLSFSTGFIGSYLMSSVNLVKSLANVFIQTSMAPLLTNCHISFIVKFHGNHIVQIGEVEHGTFYTVSPVGGAKTFEDLLL